MYAGIDTNHRRIYQWYSSWLFAFAETSDRWVKNSQDLIEWRIKTEWSIQKNNLWKIHDGDRHYSENSSRYERDIEIFTGDCIQPFKISAVG